MVNLLTAQKFFTDTFGAVCFYNDFDDGYVVFSDGHKEVETLSVYFPNKLDLYDKDTKNRLVKAAGDKFYERYSGSKGMTLCGIRSSQLMVAYYVDKKIIGINCYVHLGLKGLSDAIFKFFCGININCYAESIRCFTETIETNNGLLLEKGNNIQNVMEQYLNRMGVDPDLYFRLPKKTDYYPVSEQQEMLKKIGDLFAEQHSYFELLAEQRTARHNQLMGLLSDKDWDSFYADMHIVGSSGLKKEN